MFVNPVEQTGIKTKKLFVFLLMTILSETFFTFVGSNFVTFSFFTTRHKPK